MKRLFYAAAALLIGFQSLAATLPLGPGSIFPLGPSNFPTIALGTYRGPGDVMSGASVFYGLRAYSQSYAAASGKMVNLQRASDSHTCDVLSSAIGNAGNTANCSTGADNGQAMGLWCATTTCSVLIAYDQSGNSVHENVIVGTAPIISFNCLNTVLPCIQPQGAGPSLITTGTVNVPQPFTFSLVAERTGGFTSFSSPIGCSPANISSGNVQAGFGNSANTALIYALNIVTVSSVNDNTLHSIQYIFNGASSSINADGTITGSLNPGAAACTSGSGQPNIVFASAGNALAGNIGEAILYPSALSAGNQAALCHNQSQYYGTVGSC